jgi:hypothetical protein
MIETKNKVWLIKRLDELRKSCAYSAVSPDKEYYTAKAQAYKKARELAELIDTKNSPQEVENMKVEISCLKESDKASLNIIIDLRKRIDSLQKQIIIINAKKE